MNQSKTPHLLLHSSMLICSCKVVIICDLLKISLSLSCLRERLFSNTFKCAGQLLWIGAEGDAEDCSKDH